MVNTLALDVETTALDDTTCVNKEARVTVVKSNPLATLLNMLLVV